MVNFAFTLRSINWRGWFDRDRPLSRVAKPTEVQGRMMSFSGADFFRPRAAGRPRASLLAWALRPLYRLYEERLAHQIEGDPVPRHIGIILDGNRRHGERNGVRDPRAIYALGAQKLDDLLDWSPMSASQRSRFGSSRPTTWTGRSNRSQVFSRPSRRRFGPLLTTPSSTTAASGSGRSGSWKCCRPPYEGPYGRRRKRPPPIQA